MFLLALHASLSVFFAFFQQIIVIGEGDFVRCFLQLHALLAILSVVK
jgi:hypothetical protein